jgi:hypothetical protein
VGVVWLVQQPGPAMAKIEVRDSAPTVFVEKSPAPALPTAVARLLATPVPPRPRPALPRPALPPPRRYDTATLAKIIVLMLGAIVFGTLAGVLVVQRGDRVKRVASVAPAPPPTAEPVVTPIAPSLAPASSTVVPVHFDSQPRGANVTVLGDSRAVFIGTTPVTVSIDTARVYDVVFTLEGHAPKLERVAPLATQYLTVELESADAHVVTRRSRHARR